MTLFRYTHEFNHTFKKLFFLLLAYFKRINMKKALAAGSLFILGIPSTSIAHPGHGETDGYTIIHYFTEPVHAVIAIGVLAAVAVFIRQMRRSKQANKSN